VKKRRDYWSVVPLGVFAVVLVIVGILSRNDTIAGVGYGFAGAAITRAVDVAQERRRQRADEDTNRRRDLDGVDSPESRRSQMAGRNPWPCRQWSRPGGHQKREAPSPMIISRGSPAAGPRSS
jgi:hypothetical protein